MLLIFDSITSSSLWAAMSIDTLGVSVDDVVSFSFTLLANEMVTNGYIT